MLQRKAVITLDEKIMIPTPPSSGGGGGVNLRLSTSSDRGSYHSSVSLMRQWKQVGLSLAIFFVGWLGPDLFRPSEEALRSKKLPVQTTAAGDVILDFQIYHELVDPPMFPCTLCLSCHMISLPYLRSSFLRSRCFCLQSQSAHSNNYCISFLSDPVYDLVSPAVASAAV